MKKCCFILLAFVVVAGCGEDPDPPNPMPGRITIYNQSQYVLDEVRVHEERDYRTAWNSVPDALAVGARLQHVGLGSVYVTVFREKYRGGPQVALTTADPIELAADAPVELTVFDEVFRMRSTSR